jgi:CRISPR/Cas system-associated endonuclease Cas1
MLNYTYGILESQVRIRSVADGYDPTLGIMHECREGSSAFVFDMMEPERPKVDRSIFGVCETAQVSCGGFCDPVGWRVSAQSGDGEACGAGCF